MAPSATSKPPDTSTGEVTTTGEATVPKGLALFRSGTSPAKRRRRGIFLAFYLAVAMLVIWPVYPRFAGVEPLILGLPLSFAWVVLALILMFGGLLWLFLTEDHDEHR